MTLFIAILLGFISLYHLINEDKELPLFNKKKGLYKCNVEILQKKYDLECEIELDKDYGDGDIEISFVKISGLPENLGEEGLNLLLNEHSIISKNDVQWV